MTAARGGRGVTIFGAGFGGVCMGIKLRRAVVSLYPVDTEDKAIEKANDSTTGLRALRRVTGVK